MTDEDGDGIYTGSVKVGKGELEYKFALDNDVERQETLTDGMPCTKTTGQYINRVLQVQGDLNADVVCFDSCDCP